MHLTPRPLPPAWSDPEFEPPTVAGPSSCAAAAWAERAWQDGAPDPVLASSGTIPNQRGTWWCGRHRREVELARVGVTADARPGQPDTFESDALFGGQVHKAEATTALEASVAVHEAADAP